MAAVPIGRESRIPITGVERLLGQRLDAMLIDSHLVCQSQWPRAERRSRPARGVAGIMSSTRQNPTQSRARTGNSSWPTRISRSKPAMSISKASPSLLRGEPFSRTYEMLQAGPCLRLRHVSEQSDAFLAEYCSIQAAAPFECISHTYRMH